jgi:TonB family protein
VASKPQVARMNRGKGGPPGSFPNPPFVANIMRSGETALVEILIEVAPDGTMTNVEVQKSSGYFELDRKIVQHIKSRWKFDPPGQVRMYMYPHEQRVQ